MISYNLHLHDFPETFKGHKMGRLQEYFGYLDMISYNLHLHDFPETFKRHKMGRLQHIPHICHRHCVKKNCPV